MCLHREEDELTNKLFYKQQRCLYSPGYTRYVNNFKENSSFLNFFRFLDLEITLTGPLSGDQYIKNIK